MAAFDFPNTPTVGDSANGYVWDGEKWVNGALGTLIYVSDSAPAAPVGALWWESDTGILFFKYNDGNSTQWVAISDGGAGAVRFDMPQVLTATQQAQARRNVYAAPLDALAYNGMQVNGAFQVNQELGTGGLSVSGAVKYVSDSWMVGTNGVQVIGTGLNPGTVSSYGNGMQLSVLTANAAPATSHYVYLLNNIEGYRIARLGWGTPWAQPLTIGFYIYAGRPGAYSGAVCNGGFTRGYPFTITINAANNWEYKTITIPGDTAGTWDKTNGTGMYVIFNMMCGSDFTAPANVWKSGLVFGVTGTINGVAAPNDVMLVTGLIVLPGIEAPAVDRLPFIMRPYDQELLTCRRYWECSNPNMPKGDACGSLSGYGANTAVMLGTWGFTEKRTNPTIYLWQNGVANQIRGTFTGTPLPVSLNVTITTTRDKIMSLTFNSPPLVATAYYDFDWQLDARL